jgi:hypothetical protein
MSGSWSIVALDTPQNGSAVLGELTDATLTGGLTWALTEAPSTLSFELPFRSYQNASLNVGATDVLLYRTDASPGSQPELVQRYRVVGRTMQLGRAWVYSASTYKELLNARIFLDGYQLDWPGSMSGTIEQSLAVWQIIVQEQGKPSGNLGIFRGNVPGTAINRSLWVSDVSTSTVQHYFEVSESVGAAIDSKIAQLDNGLEWDIEPDPANPTTRLLLNCWNVGARGGPAVLALTEATLGDGTTLDELMSDYANVFRGEGASTQVADSTLDPVVVLVPATGNPIPETVPTGRWELAESSTSLQTSDEVTGWANLRAQVAKETETWSVTLQPGAWTGKASCWIGDTLRLMLEIVAEYADSSPAQTLLSVDESLRVLNVAITTSSAGTEQVVLTLNHPKTQFVDGPIPSRLAARLARLERRA